MYGLNSTGIIRGEEPAVLSETLRCVKEWGMDLVFVSRSDYGDKYIPAEVNTPTAYVINEGGYGENGAKGAATIVDLCSRDFTHYCCAAGTGSMMAGLINSAQPRQKIVDLSVLKNHGELEKMIGALILKKANNLTPEWQIIHDYHFGGYAKYQPGLISFMNDFYQQTGIPSDFVYTGKLFYGITDLVKKGFFLPGSRLLLIHSGGLQGNTSLVKGTLGWL